jgi:hypothetical protein
MFFLVNVREASGRSSLVYLWLYKGFSSAVLGCRSHMERRDNGSDKIPPTEEKVGVVVFKEDYCICEESESSHTKMEHLERGKECCAFPESLLSIQCTFLVL